MNGAERRRRAFIKHAIDAGQCWVAGEADDPVQLLGYGVLNQSFFDQNFVALVVVREVARRRGVATTIMNALEAQCLGYKVFASTNASNLQMRALLNRLGYIDSGRIENLDEGDPELVFVKFARP